MYANFNTRLARGVKASRVAMAIMPLALFLAGCSGTLQTRSATPHDTFFRWKPQMETLPIEVHGGIERLGPDDIARQIPHGTTALQYARAADGQGKLATIPRIVLYVDSEQGLVSETYCDTSQAVQSVTTDGVESHVVAALCDGPRLIDSTTRDVRNASIQSDGMASIVKSMKRRLLYGLSAGDHVVPAEYGNG